MKEKMKMYNYSIDGSEESKKEEPLKVETPKNPARLAAKQSAPISNPNSLKKAENKSPTP